MNILVTGASGFIATNLISSFASAGHGGVAVSRTEVKGLPNGWRWLERGAVLSAPLTMEGASLAIDVVIHTEVKQHVLRPTEADVKLFNEVNVEGTRVWLNWCSDANVRRFLYFSTIKAIGESEVCQDETTLNEPSTPYGRSKRCAEELVKEWAALNRDRSAIILRLAPVYGFGAKGNITAMIEAIRAGRFRVVAGGENIKSVVAVENVVAAVEFLLGNLEPGSNIFNIVDAESYTVRQLAEMIAGGLGCPTVIKSIPFPVAQLAARIGDLLDWATLGFPITSDRLKALCENTNFSAKKLQSAGFVHPLPTAVALVALARGSVGHRQE